MIPQAEVYVVADSPSVGVEVASHLHPPCQPSALNAVGHYGVRAGMLQPRMALLAEGQDLGVHRTPSPEKASVAAARKMVAKSSATLAVAPAA